MVRKNVIIGVIGIIISCGVIGALLFYPTEAEIPEGLFQVELQEELALTEKLRTVPIGGIHKNLLLLKPGETRETYYTLYTRNGGPGEVSYKIYRVAGVYKEGKIPMPEGLKVCIEPSKFFARTHQSYVSKIRLETSPELTPCEYVFCMHVYFENGGIMDGWFTVNVV